MLTTVTAAALLNVQPQTIRKWIRAGRLPAEQVGRDYLIQDSDLTNFVRPKWGRPITKPSPNKRGRKPKENKK